MKTLITALMAISITGAAFAGSYDPSAAGLAEISGTGAYNSTNQLSNVYIEGSGKTTPSFAVVDFSTAGVTGSVTALTFSATDFSSTAGTLDFYTTTASTGNSGTSGYTYSASAAGNTNGIQGSQFGNSLISLGSFTFTPSAGLDSYTLSVSSAAQAALATEIASGQLRILIAADNTLAPTTVAKFDGIASTYAAAPDLKITTQPAPEPISTAIVIGALGTAIAKRRKRA